MLNIEFFVYENSRALPIATLRDVRDYSVPIIGDYVMLGNGVEHYVMDRKFVYTENTTTIKLYLK